MKMHLCFAAAALLAAAPTTSHAQGWKDRLKEKVKERVETRTDQAMDKGVDKAEEVITCQVRDRACADKARAAGKKVRIEGENDAAASGRSTPGEGAWLNYDFVPGEKVLFYEDYTKDEVGNFPQRLELVSGNMEIAEWRGSRYLRSTGAGEIAIPLPDVLPPRFTLEMDVYHGARRNTWGEVTVRFTERPSAQNPVVQVNWTKGGILAMGHESMTDVGQEKFADQFVPIRVMADGKYVKVYMGDKRVANVPNADLGRANKIWVRVPASDESPAYVGAIRVAAGGKKIYDAIASTGRVATHGILFDVSSDVIRPESTPTLKEIVTMLQEHGDLSLTIEGHTDGVGSASANLALSEQRAVAVRDYLVSKGIDAARLDAKGLGSTKPIASNSTAEGRQQNRRVELVKR
ncbi:MAG: OmpA family protein [Gemmatimonadaceae bacterium]|nr:OmpA family protein [Gemmatimonadaceae bacterium]NUP71767.1 OmpA family protein [Gemmatimonadaceae bacterium]NUR32825.1 OmpA family protein [Gemmatimonadaceae bacterium]